MKHIKKIIRGSIKLPKHNLEEIEQALGLSLLQSKKKALTKWLAGLVCVLAFLCITSLFTFIVIMNHSKQDVELCNHSPLFPFAISICGLLSVILLILALLCFRKYRRIKKIK